MPPQQQQALLDEVARVRLPEADVDRPLVSIIMPTWNRAQLLRRAVLSVQAQTYAGWELIVVDDGSTDDTPYVLQGLQTFDRRIRVVAGEHAGVSRARNAGLAAARGKYVAFLDSDNTWQPDFLRVALSAMHSRGLRRPTPPWSCETATGRRTGRSTADASTCWSGTTST
jgi:cellulose synthase/poly-beta-1,6-N-acetylglucosamine synthase-like glycosyltransferase